MSGLRTRRRWAPKRSSSGSIWSRGTTVECCKHHDQDATSYLTDDDIRSDDGSDGIRRLLAVSGNYLTRRFRGLYAK